MQDPVWFTRIVLADGTVIENSECDGSTKRVWCFLRGMDIFEAFRLFSSPEKFRTVVFESGIAERYTRITYSGIVTLNEVSVTSGMINLRLIGDNIVSDEQTIIEN